MPRITKKRNYRKRVTKKIHKGGGPPPPPAPPLPHSLLTPVLPFYPVKNQRSKSSSSNKKNKISKNPRSVFSKTGSIIINKLSYDSHSMCISQ